MMKWKACVVKCVWVCLILAVVEGRQQESPTEEACWFGELRSSMRPDEQSEFEAGRMEYWDHTNPEFRCAGVAMARTTIHQQGLFLPSFFSSPALAYVVQGEGVMGLVNPGCPETFQEAQQTQGPEEQERGGGRFRDMHQKIQNFRRGEIFALPAGVSHWWYNAGNTPVKIVIVLDITNRHNQLDQNPRMFQIAGSRPQESGQKQRGERQLERFWASSSNLFSGFDARFIAEAFNIDADTAQKLQNQQDRRGNIVRVQGSLHFVSPRREQRREMQDGNGIEETFCTARFHENIDHPSRADVYSSRAGRLSTLNSYTLPVLRSIRLNAMRGILYSNGMLLPHWTQNAHSIMYVTGGQATVQVVDDNGRRVFDGRVGRGEVVVIPQGFAVLKRAEENGFEWISFKTNDNAKINTLAGRTSYMRAVPVDVISAAYGVPKEEAARIKFSRDETTLASTAGRGLSRGQTTLN